MPKCFLKIPAEFLHHVGDANRSATRNTCETVNEYTSVLAISLNEFDASFEVNGDIIAFSVMRWQTLRNKNKNKLTHFIVES